MTVFIRFINSVKHGNLLSKADRFQYVSNPLNLLGLVRKAHEDWPKLMAYIRDSDTAKGMNNNRILKR